MLADEKIPGLSYRIEVFEDPDAGSPAEQYGLYPESCYTQAQQDAHDRGDWMFAGVVVTPLVGGLEIDGAADSLWGVEFGHYTLTDDEDRVQGTTDIGLDEIVKTHPVPDMLDEVRAGLRKHLEPVSAAAGVVLAALPAADCCEGCTGPVKS